MPIHTSWYIPKRVILLQLVGDIKTEDIHAMNQHMHVMLNSGEPLVHVLIDQTHIGKFPVNLKELQELLSVMHYEDFGNLIMYGKTNPLGEFISGMLARIARLKLRVFKSREMALEYMYMQDASLEHHYSDAPK